VTLDPWAVNWVQYVLESGLIKAEEEQAPEGAVWGNMPASREWIARVVIRAAGVEGEALGF